MCSTEPAILKTFWTGRGECWSPLWFPIYVRSNCPSSLRPIASVSEPTENRSWPGYTTNCRYPLGHFAVVIDVGEVPVSRRQVARGSDVSVHSAPAPDRQTLIKTLLAAPPN